MSKAYPREVRLLLLTEKSDSHGYVRMYRDLTGEGYGTIRDQSSTIKNVEMRKMNPDEVPAEELREALRWANYVIIDTPALQPETTLNMLHTLRQPELRGLPLHFTSGALRQAIDTIVQFSEATGVDVEINHTLFTGPDGPDAEPPLNFRAREKVGEGEIKGVKFVEYDPVHHAAAIPKAIYAWNKNKERWAAEASQQEV